MKCEYSVNIIHSNVSIIPTISIFTSYLLFLIFQIALQWGDYTVIHGQWAGHEWVMGHQENLDLFNTFHKDKLLLFKFDNNICNGHWSQSRSLSVLLLLLVQIVNLDSDLVFICSFGKWNSDSSLSPLWARSPKVILTFVSNFSYLSCRERSTAHLRPLVTLCCLHCLICLTSHFVSEIQCNFVMLCLLVSFNVPCCFIYWMNCATVLRKKLEWSNNQFFIENWKDDKMRKISNKY